VVETSLLEHRSAGISGPAPLAETQAVNSLVCTVEIRSLEKALSQSIALGGTGILPKMPIRGVGCLAYVKDPDGEFGEVCSTTFRRCDTEVFMGLNAAEKHTISLSSLRRRAQNSSQNAHTILPLGSNTPRQTGSKRFEVPLGGLPA
jgi:hypothetical protein